MEQQLKNVRDLGLLPLNSKSKYKDANEIIKEVNIFLYQYAFIYVTSTLAYYIREYFKVLIDTLMEMWKTDTDLTKRQVIEGLAKQLEEYRQAVAPMLSELPDKNVEVRVKKFALTKWLKQREEWRSDGHTPTIAEVEPFIKFEKSIEDLFSETRDSQYYKPLKNAIEEKVKYCTDALNKYLNFKYK